MADAEPVAAVAVRSVRPPASVVCTLGAPGSRQVRSATTVTVLNCWPVDASPRSALTFTSAAPQAATVAGGMLRTGGLLGWVGAFGGAGGMGWGDRLRSTGAAGVECVGAA